MLELAENRGTSPRAPPVEQQLRSEAARTPLSAAGAKRTPLSTFVDKAVDQALFACSNPRFLSASRAPTPRSWYGSAEAGPLCPGLSVIT
jgi:hypothetical protein